MSCSVFIIMPFLLLLIHDSAAPIALKSCRQDCGKIEIPYPFGVGEGCYLDETGYEIECTNHIPFLRVSGTQVVKISLPREYSDDESWLHGSVLIRSYTTSRNEQEGYCSLWNLKGLVNAQWLQKNPYPLIELEWSFRTKNISSITTLGCGDDVGSSCVCKSRTENGMINANNIIKCYPQDPFFQHVY